MQSCKCLFMFTAAMNTIWIVLPILTLLMNIILLIYVGVTRLSR